MKLYKIIPLLLMVAMLTGCKTQSAEVSEDSNLWDKFTAISCLKNFNEGTLYEVYDNDTKVMYYIWWGGYRGGICPVYDENGNVKIYEGE